ncbi:MAG: leucine-rich repeat domain-containing protein [Breznakia sp.]
MKRTLKISSIFLVVICLVTTLSVEMFGQSTDVEQSEKQSFEQPLQTASSHNQLRGVGASIADNFSDTKTAQAIADKVASGDVNAIIDATMVSKTLILDLSYKSLTNLDGIGVFTSLASLNLANNALTTLPDDISNLKSLSSLMVFNNQLTSIPTAIGELGSLTKLSLNNNQLTSLPTEIGNLSRLTELKIDNNAFTQIPSGVFNLTSLKKLYANTNQITSIPASISNLINLTDLILLTNQISSLPKEIGDLSNLTTLKIAQNTLTSLPAEFGNLSKLKTLQMQENNLTSLPSEIVNLASLDSVQLESNNIIDFTQAQHDFFTNIRLKRFTNQTYSQTLTSVAETAKDYELPAYPAHSQFLNYGGTFAYELTKPDQSFVIIEPVLKDGVIKINGSDLHARGSYTLTSKVVGGSFDGSIYTQTFNVYSNTLPTLSVPIFTEINLNDNFNAMNNVVASDAEDGDLISEVVCEGSVDTKVAGIYKLSYSLKDSDDNKVNAMQIVLVNDESYSFDTDYIIHAEDFKIHVNKADMNDEKMIALANVKVYDVENGIWLEEPEITVDRGDFKAEVGTYEVSFTYNPSIRIEVSVYDDEKVVTPKEPLPTGDTSNVGYTVVFILSAIILVVGVYKRSKNKKI